MAKKSKPDDLLAQPIESPPPEAETATKAERPAKYQTSNERPLCPWHNCECEQTGTAGPLRRFKCPRPRCNYTTKIARKIARTPPRRRKG